MGRRGIVPLVLLWSLVAFTAPVLADYQSSRAWFAALPEQERVEIQLALALSGDYDAFLDGKFGRSTFAALTAFETRSGTPPDGVLSREQVVSLRSERRAKVTQFGYTMVQDAAGLETFLPLGVLTEQSTTAVGSRYASANDDFSVETVRIPRSQEAFPALFSRLSRSSASQTVAYHQMGAGWFVVSGTQGDRDFYAAFIEDGEIRLGFWASWRASAASIGKPAAILAASYLGPSSAAPSLAPSPASPSTSSKRAGAKQFGSFFIYPDRPNVIVLDGDITISTPLEFRRALDAEPDAGRVELNSPGGLVDSALAVAYEIFDRRMATDIPAGAGCYSACAYMFFAGWSRHVEGELGVHQLYNAANDLRTGQSKLSDVMEAMQKFGISNSVLAIMMRTLPEDIHVFDRQELADFGLITDGVAPVLEPRRSTGISPGAPRDPSATAGRQSLLLEASDSGSTGAVPFSGLVSWSRGWDDHGRPTIMAHASIPARGISLDLLIRRNFESSLPATHLIEINFSVSPSFIGGSVAGLPGILLKNDELVQGRPLIGASARVMGNQFLFALSSGDLTSNLDLLRSQKWIDVAIVYATGKRSILTLEKDEAADIMFRDVLDAWASENSAATDVLIERGADNVTIVPRTTSAVGANQGSTERVLTLSKPTALEGVLLENGFTVAMVDAIVETLGSVYQTANLPRGAHLRILLGPSRLSGDLIPYRLSIYIGEEHVATVALTDRGEYVLGIAPAPIDVNDHGHVTTLGGPLLRTDEEPDSAPGKQERRRATQ